MEDIIKYKIPEQLKYKDLKTFCSSDEKIFKIWKDKLKKLEEVYNLFTEDIIEMIGEERFLKGHKIEWENKWMGNTEYIDKVDVNDLKYNLSYGKDKLQRSFIFVKAVNENDDQFAMVIFQRRTNGKLYCSIESRPKNNYKADAFFAAYCGINSEFKEIMKKLFENGYYNSEKSKYYKYFFVKLL
jgi:hypothetical protein